MPGSPPSPSKGVREPLGFGADAEDAYRFVFGMGFARSMLQGLDREGRERALEALRATLVAHDTGNGVLYPSAAWIIGACRPVREEDPAHV